MKMKVFFPVLLMHVALISFGQKNNAAYKFHSINNISLINGDKGVSAGLQSVNGVQKGNLFAGVGLGLDYYLYRTVPLFADLRYEFGKTRNKFFAYADGGVNLEWVEETYNDGPIFIWEGSGISGEFHNGAYTDLGFGYMIGTKKGGGLVLSLGHSYKSLKKTISYPDWRTQETITDMYHYNLNRIFLKVGWNF
ncbi:MAG: hypothetical protein E6H08_08230 [Bacteroidetes bacterium]|jgi:hypothetical protein|nr:MAG: hypothetical protein E6H08_08230 [Bacteroidota bacterium]